MKSSEFLGFIGKVKQLCEISASFKEEREEQQDFDWLFKGQYESKFNLKNIPEVDTKIIDMKKEWFMIESWFDRQQIKLEKLYRASEDGFTGEKFYSKCNNQSPMLIAIQSEHDKRFGAFINVKFDCAQKKYFEDEKAFIFSLSNQIKLPIKNEKKGYAFYANNDRIFIIGGGHELDIRN